MGKKIRNKASKPVKLDTETLIAFQEIKQEARDLMIHQLLKRLTRLQDRVNTRDALLRQNDTNFMLLQQEQEERIANLQDVFDKRLEGIIDHLTAKEIDFIKDLQGITLNVSKKMTNAVLLAAIKDINILAQKKMEEINAGTDMSMENKKK